MTISNQMIAMTGRKAGEPYKSFVARLAQTLRVMSAGSCMGACPELGTVVPYGGAAVAMPFSTQAAGEFRALAAVCHAHGFRIVALIDESGMGYAEQEEAVFAARRMSADDVRIVGLGDALSADRAA